MTIQKTVRTIMISLAGLCCIAPVTKIKAADNTYEVQGAYEITIPAEVSVDSADQTSVLPIKGNLDACEQLDITVSSENDYQLSVNGSKDSTLGYTVSSDKIVLKKEGSTSPECNLTIEVQGTPQVSGVYTDKLIFTMDAHGHTLSFDTNTTDTSVVMDKNSKFVPEGKEYGTLPTPQRDGYTFQGWYTDATDGDQVTSETTMGKVDTTIYAHWKENILTINYHNDGAAGWSSYKEGYVTINNIDKNGIVETETVKYTEEYVHYEAGLLDVRRFQIMKGYHSGCKWKIGSIDSSNLVTDEQDGTEGLAQYGNTGYAVAQLLGVQEEFKKKDVTVDLYPVFVANTYTVKYDANAEDVSGSTADSSHTYDVETSLTKNGYSRENYTFGGWMMTADGSEVAYTDGQKVNIGTTNNSTVTLYAKWNAITYNISLIQNASDGSSASTTSYTVTKGSTYGDLPTPVRDGFTFQGWYTAASDGTKVTSDTIVTDGASLYAQWKENTLTINYYNDGAQVWKTVQENTMKNVAANELVESVKVTYNGKYPLLHRGLYDVSRFTKTGYSSGEKWKVNSKTASITVTDGDTGVSQYGDTGASAAELLGVLSDLKKQDVTVNLYPVFVANTYTVQYNVNGGTGTTASSTHTYDQEQALTANGYSMVGYTFNGWNTRSDGTGQSYGNNEVVTNLTSTNGATVTLYAQWKKDSTSEAKAKSIDLWEEDDSEAVMYSDTTADVSTEQTESEQQSSAEDTAAESAEVISEAAVSAEMAEQAQADATEVVPQAESAGVSEAVTETTAETVVECEAAAQEVVME